MALREAWLEIRRGRMSVRTAGVEPRTTVKERIGNKRIDQLLFTVMWNARTKLVMMARFFRCSMSTVQNVRRRLNLPQRQPRNNFRRSQ